MTETDLPYDVWIEEALREVIRKALDHTARFGLSGQHHFYVTFAPHAPGVELAAELRHRYPNDMTIVLQHQFWDLDVSTEAFSVTLKFAGRASRLTVPFTAITAFGDPSVNFGVQLHASTEMQQEGARIPGQAMPPLASPATDPAAAGEAGAQVVSLDSFRKKHP